MAWTHIQSDGNDPGTQTVTTVAITIDGVTEGNFICVFVGWEANTAHRTATCSDGTTTLEALTAAASSDIGFDCRMFYMTSAAGGDTTFTATFSGTIRYPTIVVWEYSYDNTPELEDQSANRQTASASWTTGNVTASASALCLAAGVSGGSSAWSSHAVDGNAATALAVSNYVSAWRVVCQPDDGAATVTRGNSAHAGTLAVAVFIEGTSGPATPTNLQGTPSTDSILWTWEAGT